LLIRSRVQLKDVVTRIRPQVERAKKCLDFAATIYSLHLLASFLYSGVSHTVAWWVPACIECGPPWRSLYLTTPVARVI
jgi:hypothetical protein